MALNYLMENCICIESNNCIKCIDVNLEYIYQLFIERNFCPFNTQRIVDNTRLPELWEYHSTKCDKKYYVNPKLTLQYKDEKFNIIDGQHSLYAICDRSRKEFSEVHKKYIKFDVLIYIDLDDDDTKQMYVDINQAVPVAELELSETDLRNLAEETWKLIKEYYPIKYFNGNRNCRPPRLNKSRFMDEFDKNIWESMVNRRMTTAQDLFMQIKTLNAKIENEFDEIDKKEKNTKIKLEKKLVFLSELYDVKMKADALKRYESTILKLGAVDKYCYLGLIKNCQWLNKLFII